MCSRGVRWGPSGGSSAALGLLSAPVSPFWHHRGRFGPSGTLWGPFRPLGAPLGPPLVLFGAPSGPLWGPLWSPLGPPLVRWGPSDGSSAALGLLRAPAGPVWAPSAPVWAPSGPFGSLWAPLGPPLGPFGAPSGSFGEVGSAGAPSAGGALLWDSCGPPARWRMFYFDTGFGPR